MSDYDTSNVSGTAAISAPLPYHILRFLIHSFYTKHHQVEKYCRCSCGSVDRQEAIYPNHGCYLEAFAANFAFLLILG